MAEKRQADALNSRIARQQRESIENHINRIRTAYSSRSSSTDMLNSGRKLDVSQEAKNGERSNENATKPDLNNRRKHHQNRIPPKRELFKNKRSLAGTCDRAAEKERKSPILSNPDTSEKQNIVLEENEITEAQVKYDCEENPEISVNPER